MDAWRSSTDEVMGLPQTTGWGGDGGGHCWPASGSGSPARERERGARRQPRVLPNSEPTAATQSHSGMIQRQQQAGKQ